MIPPKENAEFIDHMEDVLDLYHEPSNPPCPTVCSHETSKQLATETWPPRPAAPGQIAHYDYGYERNGVHNLFLFFEPPAWWRHIEATERRTKLDWAHCLKELVDESYPNAERIRVVMDNLNAHNSAVLYEAFKLQEARRLLNKLELHNTPRHGSWLNLAEIEFGALFRQCPDRRMPDDEAPASRVAAWEADRSTNDTTVNWRNATDDARVKPSWLHPSPEH